MAVPQNARRWLRAAGSVPVIRGGGKVTQGLATVKKHLPKTGADHLLGFNDLKGQAAISVSKAISLRPQLEASGLRLGASATIKPDAAWLVQFMVNAERKVLRVDFLPVHIYGWPNADDFLGKLEARHKKYQLPTWVTEYAVADFKATSKKPNRWTREMIREFMTDTVAGMNALPYVERFAWKTRATTDMKMGTSAFFHNDGSPTTLGRLYASL